jgi:hypothetical protein
MTDPELDSLPAELVGEDALTQLPLRTALPSEIWLEARSLTSIDAFGGAALRTRVEYHARHRQKQVMVTPPANDEAWSMLYAMLENDPPAHLILPSHRVPRPGPLPRSILVPAVPANTRLAEALGSAVAAQAAGEFRRQLRLLGAYLPELVDNTQRWATDSPLPATVCLLHHRPTDELQLVVCDLGSSLARRADAARALNDLIAAAPEGGLQSLVDESAERDLGARVVLAAGPGRLRCDGGDWQEGGGSQVDGFATAVVLPAKL